MKSECQRFSQCPVQLDVDSQDIPKTLDGNVALCLFRIAQERLRNVAHHAKASQAEVRLLRLDGGLQLTIRDNGAGYDPQQGRAGMNLGHASMLQRVRLLGGKIDIASGPGHGTAVVAWVPLSESRMIPPRARPADARGLVEFIDNPRHRRSKLVRLTRKGNARYRE